MSVESSVLSNEKDVSSQFHDLLQFLSSYYFSYTIPAALIWHRQGLARKEKGYSIPTRRSPSSFDQRLVKDTFCIRHCHRADFNRHIRMSYDSFTRLLSVVKKNLEVDNDMAGLRGGAILPEICLYVCLRYLAGGSYSDIKFFTGISVASFYRVFWKTIGAITRDDARDAALGFQSISQQGCIWNCVAVLDGYHLQIQTPSKTEDRNVRLFF